MLKKAVDTPRPPLSLRAGVYCRLSRDDRQSRGNSNSSSIETQKETCSHHLHAESIPIYDFYVDDGWSGTNFDRPAWRNMLSDVESGKINMIVVKDLSRAGRDAAGLEIFLEQYCTEKGIRLVAVLDNIDTSSSSNSEIIAILNMLNSLYPKTVSAKAKQAKASGARKGWFMGSYPPFGYAGVIIGTSPRKPLITGVSPT